MTSTVTGSPAAKFSLPQKRGRPGERLWLVGVAQAIVLSFAFALVWPTVVSAESLAEALSAAYLNNPRLLAQRAQLRATDEQVPQAISGYRPTVSASGSGGKSRSNSQTAFFGARENRSPTTFNLALQQPLFRGFRTSAQIRQAKNSVKAERARLIGVEQGVLLAAATAYMDLVRDQAVLVLNKGNEQVLGRQLQATQDRFEVGEVTRTDVSQAEARVARAVADRIRAEGALEISKAVYRNVVGQSPGRLNQPESIVQLPASREETLQTAADNSPDVAAARFNEKASRSEVDLVKGELLPTINLNGDFSRNLSTSSSGSRSSSVSIVAQITVPLYQAGAVSSRVRQAKQVVSQRRVQIIEAQRNAIEGGDRAWEILTTARARIRAFEAETRANEIALEGVSQEATAGLRTVLDVLDAEQELLDARVNLVGARRDEVVAGFQLQASVGWLTAARLGLSVESYNVKAYYDDVRMKPWGLGEALPEVEK